MRFKSQQDWHHYLNSDPKPTPTDLQKLRLECYQEIETLRQTPLIVYASKFLDSNQFLPNTIDLSDVEGFSDLINSIEDGEMIDVLLHSPGGSPDATERLVYILRNRFKKVNFLVPHSAYSAATMLALSGNKIILHPVATLGPIDPQINGIPARSIKNGFNRVKENIKNEGPEVLPAYIPLIEKYSLDLLELCDDSETLSNSLVSDWLKKYMFNDASDKAEIIIKATEFFSNYDQHKMHSRPLIFSKIKDLGLNISLADKPLSELLWEAFILFNGFFGVTAFVKLYENCHGVSYGRQQLQIPFDPQLFQQQPKAPDSKSK